MSKKMFPGPGLGLGTRRKHVGKNAGRRMLAYVIFAVLFISIILYVLWVEQYAVLPTVMSVMEFNAKNSVNKAIDKAIKSAVMQYGLKSSDFIDANADGSSIEYISVNTVLVNSICSDLSVIVSDELHNMGNSKINIPLGVITGIEALANHGPGIAMSILPIGEARVDYKTSFKSVGINQTNLQIWLEIDASVKVVIPLQHNDVQITRRIALVDTVINGKVPNYFGGQSPVLVQ